MSEHPEKTELKQEENPSKAQKYRKLFGNIFEFFLALVFYVCVAAALTWPTIMHLDSVLLGGGELGGWLWRKWWHFEEVHAIKNVDMGFFASLEALISLGRYPETGNILDILLFSYPLRNWFGFPADHNLKILLILIGNGLCGYALAPQMSPFEGI